MRICFTGAQGTGKTTLLDALELSFLKKSYEFKKSFTRDLLLKGFKINEEGDDATQLAIMEGHKRLSSTAATNTVFDRCAIDGYVYTLYLYTQGKVSEKTLDIATHTLHDCLKAYDIIFYLPPEFAPEADGVRSDSIEYRDVVAELFQQTIDYITEENLCKVIPLKGSVESRLKKILKVIG